MRPTEVLPTPSGIQVLTSHEFGEHLSEMLLRVRARALGELLAEAGRALAELQFHGSPPRARGARRTIELPRADPGALLVDWLNELIYLAEAERWLGTEFAVTVTSDGALIARVGGVRLARSPGLVKAATLHGVLVRDIAGGVEAEVVLDV